MTSPSSPPGGGEFFLDTELARAAVDQLRTVHEGLVGLRKQAADLARPDRSARDVVSSEAFDLLAQRADGGPGSFAAAMSGGIAHVETLIEQMEADIARQEEVDAASQRRILET